MSDFVTSLGIIAVAAIAIASIFKSEAKQYLARAETMTVPTHSVKEAPASVPVDQDDNPMRAELYFERNFMKSDNWDKADAILHHILKTPASQTILVIGQLEIIKKTSEFYTDVETCNIKFQLINLKVDDRGGLEHINFKLFSNTESICELRAYVDKLVEDFLVMKKNNLGTKTYYFDQIIEKKQKNVPAPQKILFSKHLFETNKTLENVFHERQDELKARVEFFLEHKAWYDEKGIPYTLGLLLHGSPGTGKTSSIKAIANMSKRHIINIHLSSIRTRKQLKKLFYDERLEICDNLNNTNNITDYIIPIDKRVYVIEDIDAINSDLVLRRTARMSENMTFINIDGQGQSNDKKLQFTNEMSSNQEEETDLDLATILNIIDGTLETPGRILIITSNYPEKLDEALIRPGRIDMLIEFKKCNHKIVHDMFESFFDVEPDSKLLEQIPEYLWSPAEVGQLLFKNFGNPDKALQELVQINPRDYFKFSHVDHVDRTDHITEPTPEPAPQISNQEKSELTSDIKTQLQEVKQFTLELREDLQKLQEKKLELTRELDEQVNALQLKRDQNQHDQPINEQNLSQDQPIEQRKMQLDMMTDEELQVFTTVINGKTVNNALQANTHQGTYTLLGSDYYKPSENGYAYAGIS